MHAILEEYIPLTKPFDLDKMKVQKGHAKDNIKLGINFDVENIVP